ncbi:MAG: hypothetical protein KNU04_gp77 [crAssphage sp. isolate ctbg_1]|uniref:Uncharacterized protein n=1 Tax=crAssphage sp. isolate ctbg_1 TaxID=2989854 RepID=A0A345MT12_9CAUD|nr:MAG: hypothetical protein KNU04_gp77 [crAssphage sp. isolate ctbg_1]AXH74512.1 MAG: hypothetical protein [crAssphage sp. isolate ctbg_1]
MSENIQLNVQYTQFQNISITFEYDGNTHIVHLSLLFMSPKTYEHFVNKEYLKFIESYMQDLYEVKVSNREKYLKLLDIQYLYDYIYGQVYYPNI